MAQYRERYGCYPERILADKIYRNRQILAFCKEHGIHLSGPALGKSSKDPDLSPSSEETGVSGQLRPQRCGKCFRASQDRLWPSARHGTPAGNCCLCYWLHPAALEPFQVTEGLSRSVVPHVSGDCFAEVAK